MEDLLRLWNPWWKEGNVPSEWLGIDRAQYTEPLVKEAGKKFVSVVTGPRRTGKTTILFQTIQRLIDGGREPTKILYAMLDSPALPMDSPIESLLREFRKLNDLGNREKATLFLDEAQHVEDWARWAKAIHDSRNAKLYISGSTTAMIEQDSHASLVGRWRKTMVHPLDFREFLRFVGVKADSAEQYRLEGYVEKYARTGGFPEVVMEKDPLETHRILTGYFDDFIFKDAARARPVRDLEMLKRVATLMAHSVGTPASVNKMAKALRVSTSAIAGYIDALCSTYLYIPCEYHTTSAKARAYNPKKYYLADTGLAHAVGQRTSIGTLIENLVHNHMAKASTVNYWRSMNEVDLYLPEKRLAMEVKYRDNVERSDVKGLLQFAEKKRLKEVFIATSSLASEEIWDNVRVRCIPVHKVLIAKEPDKL